MVYSIQLWWKLVKGAVMQEPEIQRKFIEKRVRLHALLDTLHQRIGLGKATPTDLKKALKVASTTITECVAKMEKHRHDDSSPLNARALSVITYVLGDAATVINEVILAFAIANLQ
jgi:hypothetical protein